MSDDTGAVLPGVSVQLRTENSTSIVDAVTDALGRYEVRAEQPGPHSIRFSLINFSQRHATGDARTRPCRAVVDVVLPLALTADVTVTGAPDVQKSCRGRESLGEPASASPTRRRRARSQPVQLEGRPLSRPAEVLETVPGLVISQHSGEGKANQYYLRGFNLDHGTDFAVSVAGIPVNMPTHGHGQGWSDVNFLIPELVSGVQFKKGPYYADEGDFSTAGAASINYVNSLERPLLRLTGGGDRFGRMLAAASPRLASGTSSGRHRDGKRRRPVGKPRGLPPAQWRRALQPGRYAAGARLTFMGYDAKWTATDQVPERAVSAAGSSRGSARSIPRMAGRHTATRSLPRSSGPGPRARRRCSPSRWTTAWICSRTSPTCSTIR